MADVSRPPKRTKVDQELSSNHLKKDEPHVDSDGKSENEEASEREVGDDESEDDPKFEGVLRVQHEIVEIENEEQTETVKLTESYIKKKKPLFDQRQVEIQKLDPHFWATVLQGHPVSRRFIANCDFPLLQHLTEVNIGSTLSEEREEDMVDLYRITFKFSPNPFINDAELWRDCVIYLTGVGAVTSGISWKQTIEAESIKSRMFTKMSDDVQDSPSIFSLFEEDAEPQYDNELCEALRGDIFTDPIRLYKHPVESEGEEEGSVIEEDTGSEGNNEPA